MNNVTPTPKEEKKVEYLELVYDLIFVYVLGRNNSLLHNLSGGFVSGQVFAAYILGSLVAIQIWMFSTYYINMFGRNKAREYVFLFINMYLLYYIAEGTRMHWEGYVVQYFVAWALILVNIAVQYLIERRNHPEAPDVRKFSGRMAAVLFAEAAIVLTESALFYKAGAYIAALAIAVGVIGTRLAGEGAQSAETKSILVDFPHLSERAMLYVVFTFGEMIIAVASYFEGGFSLSSVYYSLMAFLIIAGLFLSYGILYNRIIDREMRTTGMNYMIIHIFLIFALNDITTALEFMKDEEVSLMPKVVFLVSSFVLCYVCLLLLGRYAKVRKKPHRQVILRMAGIGAGFIVLMLLLHEHAYANIALTVLFVFAVFLMLRRFSLHQEGAAAKHGVAPDSGDQSVNSGVE